MDLKEIKKLIELSGGKLIMVDNDSNSTMVAMKLEEYLKDISTKKRKVYDREEKKIDGGSEEKKSLALVEEFKEEEGEEKIDKLTDQELLDRINDNIAELKERRIEKQVDEFELELDKNSLKYEII